MTHEESIALKNRLLAGEEISDGELDEFATHLDDESCGTCASLRQSVGESRGWRPRSIREFHALIIADAVLTEADIDRVLAIQAGRTN